MLEFLTDELRAALKYVNENLVYELRVRAGKPTAVNYKGKYYFLGKRGLTDKAADALVCSYQDIETVIYRVSEYSVYSVTEQVKQGFLTGAYGERIGLCGSYVYENGAPSAIKEITSLNIRVPHEVKGAASFIFEKLFSKGVCNCLLLSAPGRGKTTILRDLARLISSKYCINILILDERNEITAAYKDFSLDVGAFCDVVRYAYKRDALSAAVRTMRPDLIITDELAMEEELAQCLACVRSGVQVIASAHCKDYESLLRSPVLHRAVSERGFDYYIALDPCEIGKVACIFDGEGACVYGP